MNIIPDIFAVSVTFGVAFKGQISPANIAMLVALGLCVVVVWIWAKGKLR